MRSNADFDPDWHAPKKAHVHHSQRKVFERAVSSLSAAGDEIAAGVRRREIVGAGALGAAALGALAIGALVVGAFAIGRLAVGRAGIEEAEIKRLRIGALEVSGVLPLDRDRGDE